MRSNGHVPFLLMVSCPQVHSYSNTVWKICKELHHAISLTLMHIYNILPNSICQHHLEQCLQTIAELAKARVINNRQRVLMTHIINASSFLATYLVGISIL
jgi:hypothetical protein